MTYNIHHGRGADGAIDLERIAAVVRAAGPDLVALQEVDVGTGRAGGVDQAAELGRLTGMQVVFGEAMPYDGGSYGEAVLSALPIESSAVHALPAASHHEPRAALEVRVRLRSGARVRFVGTHLDHTDDPADRIAQARAIEAALADEADLATVLAGDFNDEPGAESLAAFALRWLDALGPDRRPTWPADEPRVAIDHVFVAPHSAWRKTAAHVVEERVASDHRPVVVDLELVR
jgi:endonuclease/exonuclease/phosphatase family metal-dependent hydrolase